MITIGMKVEGNWGAMFPIDAGEVMTISESGTYVTILWDSNPAVPMMSRVDDIHKAGWTSVNGSGIGIFIAKG